MKEAGIESAVEQYAQLRPLYDQYARRLRSLIAELLDASGVPYQFIEARAKDVASFKSKISEKGYLSPISDCHDLCGLRIVVLDLGTVDTVSQLLRREFFVDEPNSGDKLDNLAHNEFGYRSVHVIGSLKTARSRLVEYKRYKGMRFEVQIRTVLQHAWAAIDHKLRYKGSLDAPQNIRRQLFRLSAFLEEADSRFDSITREVQLHQDIVQVKLSKSDLNIQIDADSLDQYFQSSARIAALVASASPMQFATAINSPETLNRAILTCRKLKISTISQVDAILASAEENFEAILNYIYEHTYVRYWTQNNRTGAVIGASAGSLVRLILAMCKRPALSVDDLRATGYSEEISKYLVETRNKLLYIVELPKL